MFLLLSVIFIGNQSASRDHFVILHILLSRLLQILVERRLQDARVPDTIVVLARHTFVRRLLKLGINAAACSLQLRGSEAFLRVRGDEGIVPLPEPVLHHDLLELVLHV